MQLNTMIARQIVERAMKIIGHSVNVMNEQGLIIGSGDPHRLHQKHEGALLTLAENRVVEIDEATSNSLKGVRPGINLPVMFNGNAIGVVGISGPPETVRSYGELVKMTAELIVEQAALISQMQWDKRHREELVLQLIRESELNERQLLSIAQRLDLDLEQPRVAAVVRLIPNKTNALSLEHLQSMVHMLENPERDNLVGITSVSRNEIVVLKPILTDNGEWSRQSEQKKVRALLKRVSSQQAFRVQIAYGGYFPSFHGLARSFQTASATLAASRQHESVLYYEDHTLPVLLSAMPEDDWRTRHLNEPMTLLVNKDGRGTLIKTLTSFFEQNCDLVQTSENLHIHRNTLRYRLQRISEITSLDINKLEDKTHLYLSFLKWQQKT
ncbi:XRE family transcriptional regulator [Enterovibrio norvegicus FF-33]|uniref:XRE family transcriptional regulator n=1 Tax=Enterovibrio norvegicus FF-454 TaxID=1185651 RepID=A0A1E5BXH2_9GAMM|nr:sugar diacid recognition domain-containing protein [Enterovibrio norvegicus]OEE57890.1 XRE family transcriptional regulator [Enterovibrio norvegicus FF-454]OEE70528.1 XRE family transcriptional regulator [Enterovibrio norvegicus FF-33]